jgi:feruloyl esterase
MARLYRKTIAITIGLPMALLAAQPARADATAAQCAALTRLTDGQLGVGTARIASATIVVAKAPSAGWGSVTSDGMPAHCDISGVIRERTGAYGQHYAVRFRLRLPANWNGRFLFQGGGGTNGIVGNALGPVMPNVPGQPNALERGFAVVSTDTGHDNVLNFDQKRGGIMAFGHDYPARLELAERSLDSVATVAKHVIAAYFGRAPARSYVVGCSNGGFEGMVFAQRFPDQFDGIVSGAPAFAVPKAALAAAWQTQIFARLAEREQRLTPAGLPNLASALSPADLGVVAGAIMKACDGRDGVEDGLIQDFAACTTDRVRPAFATIICANGRTTGCVTPDQIAALTRAFEGPVDGAGKPIYAEFPWDGVVATPTWRMWKLNDGDHPAYNVALMTAGLAGAFMTPPHALDASPDAALRYSLAFDFSRDADGIYATTADFSRSSWDMMAAQSLDLSRFRARGGKMIVFHGSGDPVFSLNDTARWWRGLDKAEGGHAAAYVRFFAVPGMGHCGSGNATDEFDPLTTLVDWVEQGRAPDRIVAAAGKETPWPGRTRPLCLYPRIARYEHGDAERAESFACELPTS